MHVTPTEGLLPSLATCTALEKLNCDNNKFTGECFTDSSVLPDIPTVVFFFLKTDLIRAFYAGALPSFATCIALTDFRCHQNQFSGA